MIVALRDGVVEEQGTHDELMKNRGLYHSLVTAQITEDEDDEEKEMDDVVEDLDIGELA